MDVICDPDQDLVYKRARTSEERRLLGREAALLRAVAHPGVVQLVRLEGADPPDGLVLRRVGGPDLTALTDPPVEVVAGVGAALATTVADLHDVGVNHRAIEAAHVLLDPQGRPVLCGFGQAERDAPASRAEVLRRDDVRAVARLLLARMPSGAPRRALRVLRAAAGPGRQHRCRSARWLARQLVVTVPEARLPDAGQSERTPPAAARPETMRRRHRARPVRPALLIGGAVLVAVVAWLAGGGGAPVPARSTGSACPAADYGCGPVPAPGGYVTTASGRYQVGAPGDVIVIGRWQCGGTALPAVLRASTGEVWTFAAWPTGAGAQVGRLAARVVAARSLYVDALRNGCDRLEVVRVGHPPVRVDPVGP